MKITRGASQKVSKSSDLINKVFLFLRPKQIKPHFMLIVNKKPRAENTKKINEAYGWCSNLYGF